MVDQDRINRNIPGYNDHSTEELIERRSSYAVSLFRILRNSGKKPIAYEKDMKFMLETDSGLSLAIMVISSILSEDYISIFEGIARGISPIDGDRNDIRYWCKK